MRRRLGIVIFIALVAAAAWIEAEQEFRVAAADVAIAAARDADRPLAQRIERAAEAMRLQPQVIAYRQDHAALVAKAYVMTGNPRAARRLLIEAWALDRSNTAMREQLREVNLEVEALDTWKAHIQHAREGPGGVLAPEDVIE